MSSGQRLQVEQRWILAQVENHLGVPFVSDVSHIFRGFKNPFHSEIFWAWTLRREDFLCLTGAFVCSPASFQRLQAEKEVLYNDSRSEPRPRPWFPWQPSFQ